MSYRRSTSSSGHRESYHPSQSNSNSQTHYPLRPVYEHSGMPGGGVATHGQYADAGHGTYPPIHGGHGSTYATRDGGRNGRHSRRYSTSQTGQYGQVSHGQDRQYYANPASGSSSHHRHHSAEGRYLSSQSHPGQGPRKVPLSHQFLAAGASYEAVKAYERHVEENGGHPSHKKAKELIAAAVGAFIDREIERNTESPQRSGGSGSGEGSRVHFSDRIRNLFGGHHSSQTTSQRNPGKRQSVAGGIQHDTSRGRSKHRREPVYVDRETGRQYGHDTHGQFLERV